MAAVDHIRAFERRRREAGEREVHSVRAAATLGTTLGVSFSVCLVTGVWSHVQQQPHSWIDLPLGPTGLYRITQGLHVATGIASIPLLLAKLYSVAPHFWRTPPVRGPVHAFERLSLLPLVGGSLFLLVTGVANTAHWYPWQFFFPVGHWWAAWLTVGAIVVHIAMKSPLIRAVARGRHDPDIDGVPPEPGELSRRGLLMTAGGMAGLLTVATAGQTFPPLRPLTALAPRRPDIGPQGFPVNKSASAAGTEGLADDPAYRLTVTGDGVDRSFTLDQLQAMPQHTAELPVACVDGWSATARWLGVSVSELIRHAGISPGPCRITSAQRAGRYGESDLSADAVADPDCLLALRINDDPLHPDHGAPVRLIAPNRPGVLQTKWVIGLELT